MEASFPVSSCPFNSLCKASTALIQQKLSKSYKTHTTGRSVVTLGLKKDDSNQQVRPVCVNVNVVTLQTLCVRNVSGNVSVLTWTRSFNLSASIVVCMCEVNKMNVVLFCVYVWSRAVRLIVIKSKKGTTNKKGNLQELRHNAYQQLPYRFSSTESRTDKGALDMRCDAKKRTCIINLDSARVSECFSYSLLSASLSVYTGRTLLHPNYNGL